MKRGTYNISEAMNNKLDELSKLYRLSKAELIRMAVDDLLVRHYEDDWKSESNWEYYDECYS